MKKKLLSLLLVLCMVLPLVPVTMLSVLAAEAPLTTSLNPGLVSFDENQTVVLPQGWEFVGYEASIYDKPYVMDKSSDNVFIFGTADGVTGWETIDSTALYPLIYMGGEMGYWGPPMSANPTTLWNAGYSYTAAATGFVSIDIEKLTYCHEEYGNVVGGAKYVAIFVGGEMVWPTAGGSYTNVADWAPAGQAVAKAATDTEQYVMTGEPINPALLQDVFVEKGERIEFLVKLGDGYHKGRTVSADLKITYTDRVDAATVTAGVTLGSAFALNFAVEADADATESGVYINGKKSESASVSLVAADLAEPYTYAPYQVVKGIEIVEEAKTITALEVLGQYTAENGYDAKTVALAEATILYASAAEAYFYGFDIVSELQEIVDAMAAPEAKNAKITDAIEETATFTRANIYLNDSMDMKFFFTAENASDLTVKVEGAGDVTVTVEEVGSGYVAIVEDVPMSAYGTDLKVTVYDGETAISETLTYGVEIYAARTYDADATDIERLALNDLLKTIVNLGKAAAAYNA